MKNIAVLAVLIVAVLGCDISRFTRSEGNTATNTAKPTPSPEPKDTPKATPKPEIKPEIGLYLAALKKSAGKYPNDIKFLDIPEVSSRLKKLLGKDFSGLKAHFNVEVPIEIIGDVFMAQGCEAHNCGNSYYVFVDLKSDNINVYHVQNDVPTTFFEHGEIKLPTKFTNDISGK